MSVAVPSPDKVKEMLAREKEREGQCPLRHRSSCAEISTRLGWDNKLSMDTCDACYNAGGLEGGQVIRDTYVAQTVAHWRQNAARAPAAVFTALTINHMTQAEVRALNVSADDRLEATKKERWAKVRGKWEMAESFVRSMASRGPGALIGGGARVLPSQKLMREEQCAACPSRTPSEKKPGKHFCNDCGCGDTELALLDEEPYGKLDYPYLECPRERPGFSNAPPPDKVVPKQVDRFGTTTQEFVFNADTCGIGDICVHLWQAEGLRETAVPVKFYTSSAAKREVIEMFGHAVTKTAPHWPVTGGRAPHYLKEITEVRGKKSRLRVWMEDMGLTSAISPATVLDDETRAKGKKHVESVANGRKCVLLFPYAEWNPRRWPLNYWLDLAWGLNHLGVATICLHQSGVETETRTFPYRAWGLGWKDVGAMMLAADLVIGNDSGPTHVAGNLKVKTLALMGPTGRVFEHYGCVKELFARTECSPCFFAAERGFRAGCDVACQSLMRMLPEQVSKVAMEMLS